MLSVNKSHKAKHDVSTVPDSQLPKAMIFVDYENIYKRIEDYGSNIFDIDLVGKLREYFTVRGLNIVDFLLYANFEVENFNFAGHEDYFKKMGVTTKHTSIQGKNGSDIELIVDTLQILFNNDDIDAYIIISSDRDMLPLIQAIKQENKIVFFITTKTKFGKGMLYTTDFHEYLEQILGLKVTELDDNEEDIDISSISTEDLNAAREVIIMLISSNIWKRHIAGGTPIHFEEYKKLIANSKKLPIQEVDRLYMIAKGMKWIKLYKFQRKNEFITGIRAGEKLDEIIESDAYKRHFLGNSYKNK